jgi:thioesterase domain-containing protein
VLVTLRRDRDAAAHVVALAPLDGPAACYVELAAAMEMPVTVVAADTLDWNGSLIEAAEAVADEILGSTSSAGPDCVCGWSAGSLFALAVAQTIVARGHEPPPLILLDPPPLQWFPHLDPRWPGHEEVRRIVSRCEHMIDEAGEDGRVADVIREVRAAIEGLGPFPAFEGDDDRAVVRLELLWLTRRARLLRDMVPHRYPGNLVICLADQGGVTDATLAGWCDLAGDAVDVVHFTGTHHDLVFGPVSRMVAAELAARVRRRPLLTEMTEALT